MGKRTHLADDLPVARARRVQLLLRLVRVLHEALPRRLIGVNVHLLLLARWRLDGVGVQLLLLLARLPVARILRAARRLGRAQLMAAAAVVVVVCGGCGCGQGRGGGGRGGCCGGGGGGGGGGCWCCCAGAGAGGSARGDGRVVVVLDWTRGDHWDAAHERQTSQMAAILREVRESLFGGILVSSHLPLTFALLLLLLLLLLCLV